MIRFLVNKFVAVEKKHVLGEVIYNKRSATNVTLRRTHKRNATPHTQT